MVAVTNPAKLLSLDRARVPLQFPPLLSFVSRQRFYCQQDTRHDSRFVVDLKFAFALGVFIMTTLQPMNTWLEPSHKNWRQQHRFFVGFYARFAQPNFVPLCTKTAILLFKRTHQEDNRFCADLTKHFTGKKISKINRILSRHELCIHRNNNITSRICKEVVRSIYLWGI